MVYYDSKEIRTKLVNETWDQYNVGLITFEEAKAKVAKIKAAWPKSTDH